MFKSLKQSKIRGCVRNFSSTYPSILQVLKNNKPGDLIQVKGWIKSVRNQKENIFVDIGDGSTPQKLQIFIPKRQTSKPQLNTGASITATGLLNLSPKGQVELSAENVEVYGDCVVTDGYPFAPRKQYEPEYIRQYPHFRPRTNKFGALLRVRHAANLAIHNFFNREGFVHIHTPIITSNDCEGAGEVFKIVPDSSEVVKSMIKPNQATDEAYFNKKAYLSVSGQLHLEAAVHGLSKVFTFGPTFRAENSRSRLHLSEFYMLEAELAFVDHLETITTNVEGLVKAVTTELLDRCEDDLEECREELVDLDSIVTKKIPILTFNECVGVLKTDPKSHKDGLSKEDELVLVKHCNGPLFVVNFPKEIKPFYMRECGDGTVAAFDLLAPTTGEIVGGSLRENDYERLKSKIPPNMDWYLDLRRFGGVPTGGYGLGFERYLQFILGINNIKDTIPFPRWPHNCAL